MRLNKRNLHELLFTDTAKSGIIRLASGVRGHPHSQLHQAKYVVYNFYPFIDHVRA